MSEQAQNMDMFGFDDVSLENIEAGGSNELAYPKNMMKMYTFLKAQLDDEQARSDIALVQLKAICKAFGGIQYYLSCCRSQIRDIKIWRDFDGSNVAELSGKYQTSMQNVYRVLKKMRETQNASSLYLAKSEAEIFDKNLNLFPESTQEMYGVIKSSLDTFGLGEDVAYKQLVAMSDGFGGQQFYVPHGKQLESEMKKFRIWHEYTGHNVAELSEKYKVSMSHIWRILANMRALTIKKYQMTLF